MKSFLYTFKALVYLPSRIVFPFKLIGKENLPKKTRYVSASNHLQWTDILQLYVALPRYRNFIGKKELYDKKFNKFFLSHCGMIPINREKPDISSIREIVKILKNEGIISIFPEGSRNKINDDLQDIKGGVAMFAIKGEAPVIPIMIHHKAKGFKRNFIMVGKPINIEEFYGKMLSKDTLSACSDKIAKGMKKCKDMLDNYVACKRYKKKNRLSFDELEKLIESQYEQKKLLDSSANMVAPTPTNVDVTSDITSGIAINNERNMSPTVEASETLSATEGSER